jgi:uncharacterized membrane protein
MTDERVERMISSLLRAGVLLSALAVLAGGVCYLAHRGMEPVAYRTFNGEPAAYRSPAGILPAVMGGDCLAIVQLGFLLLIATPVARVALALFAFALEHDRVYVVVTTIVLAVLLYSLIGTHG